MGTVAIGLAVGFLACRLTWRLVAPAFAAGPFLAPNYRGAWIPSGTGVLVAVVLAGVEGGRVLAASMGVGDRLVTDGPGTVTVLCVIGFALLGLIDDLLGTPEHRGFRGHLRAFAKGTVTTGVVKLAGGAALALVVAGPSAHGSAARLVTDGLVVALSANLGNLLDRGPGRVLKGSGLAFVALGVASGGDAALVSAAVAIGAGLGLLRGDLGERLMIGDAGANAIGAVVGLGAVLVLDPSVRNALVVGLVALNILGELVSFSRIITALPLLRAVDNLGRSRPER